MALTTDPDLIAIQGPGAIPPGSCYVKTAEWSQMQANSAAGGWSEFARSRHLNYGNGPSGRKAKLTESSSFLECASGKCASASQQVVECRQALSKTLRWCSETQSEVRISLTENSAGNDEHIVLDRSLGELCS